MVQNPHHYPWRHAPSLAHDCPARPCWASGTVLTAGVATNLGGPRWRGGLVGEFRDDAPFDDARDRALTNTLCRITCFFGPMHPAVARMAGELVAP